MTSTRLAVAQLLVGAAVAVAALAYAGARMPAGTHHVTVRMADTGGLVPQSEVTYRGAPVGSVDSITIEPGWIESGGVRVELALDARTDVPVSTRAVVTQDNPLAIMRLDLRPETGDGPFLADGGEISGDATSRPLPLEIPMTHLLRLVDSIDPADLDTVAGELSTGLAGTSGDLTRILDGADALIATIERNRQAIGSLADDTARLDDTAGPGRRTLPEIAAALRRFTGELRGQAPAVERLLDAGPPLAERITPMLTGNAPAVGALLANGVSATRIVALRTAALDDLLVVAPEFFTEVRSAVHGDVVHGALVTSIGPVCVHDTPRRAVTDTAPRAPDTSLTCPGDRPEVQQRGPANAPRPPGGELAVAAYDPASGEVTTPDGRLMDVDPDHGDRTWLDLMQQGVR